MHRPINGSHPHMRHLLRARRVGCGLISSLVLSFCAWGLLPNPPPVGPFQSGGLGLTRAEWQQQYVPAYEPIRLPFTEPVYEDGEQRSLYSLDFWPEGWLNGAQARITTINPFGWGPGPEPPAMLIQQLLPADSQQVHDPLALEEPAGAFVAIYYSASLATRYPARLGAPDPWRGARLGTFYVISGHSLVITIPASGYAPPQVPTSPK